MFLDLNNAPIVPVTSVPDRGEYERYHIVPDIRWCHIREEIRHDNFITIKYQWMNKVHGFFEKVYVAKADSLIYQSWLIGYPLKDGIPPHISFGGGIEPIPGGDPTFYRRWVEYVHGELL